MTPLCLPTSDATTPGKSLPQERLQTLPFPTYAHLMARLLRSLGYTDVELMGIASGRGRNAHGGLDLKATARTGLTRVPVIAQVKQYERPLSRAFVDELRGAMLRLGAGQGLLITTGAFSPAAVEAVQMAQHQAPVRLIGGAELASLLRQHGLLGTAAPATSPMKPQSGALASGRPGNQLPLLPTPPEPKPRRRKLTVQVIVRRG